MIRPQGTIEERVQAIRGTTPKPTLSGRQKAEDRAVMEKAKKLQAVTAQEDDYRKKKEKFAKEWEQAQRTLFPEHPDRKALVLRMNDNRWQGDRITEAKARLRDLMLAYPRAFGKNWNTSNDRARNTNILRSIDQHTKMIEDLKEKLIPPYMV